MIENGSTQTPEYYLGLKPMGKPIEVKLKPKSKAPFDSLTTNAKNLKYAAEALTELENKKLHFNQLSSRKLTIEDSNTMKRAISVSKQDIEKIKEILSSRKKEKKSMRELPLISYGATSERDNNQYISQGIGNTTQSNWKPIINPHSCNISNLIKIRDKRNFENNTIDITTDKVRLKHSRNFSTLTHVNTNITRADDYAKEKCTLCMEKDKYISELHKMLKEEKSKKQLILKQLEQQIIQKSKSIKSLPTTINKHHQSQNIFQEYIKNLQNLEEENLNLKTHIKEHHMDEVNALPETDIGKKKRQH